MIFHCDSVGGSIGTTAQSIGVRQPRARRQSFTGQRLCACASSASALQRAACRQHVDVEPKLRPLGAGLLLERNQPRVIPASLFGRPSRHRSLLMLIPAGARACGGVARKALREWWVQGASGRPSGRGRWSAERRAFGSTRGLMPRIAEARAPRKRLSTLHRGDFWLKDRSSGTRRACGLSPASTVPVQPLSRRPLVVAADGAPQPPGGTGRRPPHTRRRHTPPRDDQRPGNAPLDGAG